MLEVKTRKLRRSSSKSFFTIPEGGFSTYDQPFKEGYNPKEHKALRDRDFNDPLEFIKFKRSCLKKQDEELIKQIDQLKELGSTPEEKYAKMQELRMLKSLEKLAEKMKAEGKEASLILELRKLIEKFDK